MFKVNNKDTRMTPGVVLVSLKYFTPCSSVSIVNFKYVNTDWPMILKNPAFIDTFSIVLLLYV